MDYNDHSNLRGAHSFLSPSQGTWLNYDEHKLWAKFTAEKATQRGTRLHNWAHEAIRLGIRQKDNNVTLNKYINDGIRYQMRTDVMLAVSVHAFGEADTLKFDGKTLRIHDLKTGLVSAGIRQLEIYAAYFCLEYHKDPKKIDTILRIYQNDEVKGGLADPAKIQKIMDDTLERLEWIHNFEKEVQ